MEDILDIPKYEIKGYDGYHILANFYDCHPRLNDYYYNDKIVKFHFDKIINSSGLTLEGSFFHKFNPISENQSGFTGAWILSESHISIHTWPELKRIDLDIYVCNVNNDNSSKAKYIYNNALSIYSPENIYHKFIFRGIKDKN